MDELLEKVIKGFTCCDGAAIHLGHCQEDCPYFGESERADKCVEKLHSDALSLLKAQEPRIMAADELKEYLMINDSGLLSHDQWRELSQRAPLYMEFREPDECQVNWWTVERMRPWAMESMFWEKYIIDRRCWTARPTEEQREKVKWE